MLPLSLPPRPGQRVTMSQSSPPVCHDCSTTLMPRTDERRPMPSLSPSSPVNHNKIGSSSIPAYHHKRDDHPDTEAADFCFAPFGWWITLPKKTQGLIHDQPLSLSAGNPTHTLLATSLPGETATGMRPDQKCYLVNRLLLKFTKSITP